jgi:hypothetical protein
MRTSPSTKRGHSFETEAKLNKARHRLSKEVTQPEVKIQVFTFYIRHYMRKFLLGYTWMWIAQTIYFLGDPHKLKIARLCLIAVCLEQQSNLNCMLLVSLIYTLPPQSFLSGVSAGLKPAVSSNRKYFTKWC